MKQRKKVEDICGKTMLKKRTTRDSVPSVEKARTRSIGSLLDQAMCIFVTHVSISTESISKKRQGNTQSWRKSYKFVAPAELVLLQVTATATTAVLNLLRIRSVTLQARLARYDTSLKN